ncbi:hypothetical protein GLW08_18065 [Pontibacillus yanchengensis]|uniref:Uncharacterized protein n=2 Tax=Pontibacillus yanchengensis TaxID=462910 RepID=A0ACC7VKD3_9BACI|nr:hypothetical protein [Pontibacillus yanchengensis]MYL35057.1 hypothetical protein [Pontibacillus yanchengensis]MYL55232.1 hypothetical protein [Pontibacillus yanchengensis]
MNQPVASFVVRCHTVINAGEDLCYRIKVTHVQRGEEVTFESFDEASDYMKNALHQEDEVFHKGG